MIKGFDEISKLAKGYKEFKEEYFSQDDSIFQQLKEGQSPKILLVACCDSRVDPAILFNAEPGDIFMVRNVANLIPVYEPDEHYHGVSAALEFAIQVLEVRHVIILGHTHCGGLKELFEQNYKKAGEDSFISKWVELAAPARQKTIELHSDKPFNEQVTLCGRYSLINSIENLSKFPWVANKLSENKLFLHAWQFDIETGHLYAYDNDEKTFIELT